MIIKGYFHKDRTPFVDVLLEISDIKIRRKIAFLIDTGSPITILSEKDARKLKLNFKKMNPSDNNIMGLGGFAETFILKNTIFHFFSEKQIIDVPLEDLFVYKNVTQDDDIINQIPSLLGRDILKEFSLIYDERDDNISLKK